MHAHMIVLSDVLGKIRERFTFPFSLGLGFFSVLRCLKTEGLEPDEPKKICQKN